MRGAIASAARCVPLLTATAFPATAQNLSPQEIFRRVAPSVVVVEVKEYPEKGKPRLIASGSGVIVPDRAKDEILVATNCHVVDKAPSGVVGIRQGAEYGVGSLDGRDAARDLCLVRAIVLPDSIPKNGDIPFKKLPAVQVGSSQWMEVGDPVYAVGAPQGLELSLSDGLVSGFREYEGSEYIQTTAAISPGSSGGGLFDAQGRLVGITTMYLKEGQALNFAVPAEMIASVPKVDRELENDRNPNSSAPDAAQAAADAAAASAAAAGAATAIPLAEEEERMPQEERWWTFYQDSKLEIAFDTQTAKKDGRNITVWTRINFRTPQKDSSGKTYIQRTVRDTYYCGSRQSSFDQATRRNAAGEVVSSYRLESWEVKRDDVMPDSLGEAMYEAACSS